MDLACGAEGSKRHMDVSCFGSPEYGSDTKARGFIR